MHFLKFLPEQCKIEDSHFPRLAASGIVSNADVLLQSHQSEAPHIKRLPVTPPGVQHAVSVWWFVPVPHTNRPRTALWVRLSRMSLALPRLCQQLRAEGRWLWRGLLCLTKNDASRQAGRCMCSV